MRQVPREIATAEKLRDEERQEAAKVLIASITEGEDKPIKYPYMFQAAGLVLLNKVDLAPHLDFNIAEFREFTRRVNTDAQVIIIGDGLAQLIKGIGVGDQI